MQSHIQQHSMPIQEDERLQFLLKLQAEITANGKPNFPDYIINRYLTEVTNGELSGVKKLSDMLANLYGDYIEDMRKLFKMAYFFAIKHQHPDVAVFLSYGYMPVILLQEPTVIELYKVKCGEKILLIYKKDTNSLDLMYCDHNGNIQKANLFDSEDNSKSLIVNEDSKIKLQMGVMECIEKNNIFSKGFLHELIRVLLLYNIAACGLLASAKLTSGLALQSFNTILLSPFSDKLPLPLWFDLIERTDEVHQRQRVFAYLRQYNEGNIFSELIKRFNQPVVARNKKKIMRLNDLLKQPNINPYFYHFALSSAGMQLAIKMKNMQLFTHLIKTSLYYGDFLRQINNLDHEIMDDCNDEMRLILHICKHVANMKHWKNMLVLAKNNVTPRMLVSNYFIALSNPAKVSIHILLVKQLLQNPGIQALHDKDGWDILLEMIGIGQDDILVKQNLLQYIYQKVQPIETVKVIAKRKIGENDPDINSVKHKPFCFFTLAEAAHHQYIDSLRLRAKIKEAWSVLREVFLVIKKFDLEENLVIPLHLYRDILTLTLDAIQRDKIIVLDGNQDVTPSLDISYNSSILQP